MIRSTPANTPKTTSSGATLVRLLVPFARWWRDQRGSQGIGAAGAALAAALIVAALLAASGMAGPRVERAMECAAGVLSGGGGCAGGAAPDGGGAPPVGGRLAQWAATLFGGTTEIADRSTGEPPDSTLKPCPTLPNAGVVDHPVPQNMTDLWNAVNALYQGDAPDQQGPIGITQIGDNRYLVTLSGIEEMGFFGSERYNNLNNAISEAMGGTSPYQEQVMATIRAQIPPGAELVIAGHSEGGIVAQNLAANHAFNRNASSWWNYPWNEARRRLGWGQGGDYRVTHIVSFGSPMSQVPVDGVDYTMITTSADPVSLTGLYGRGGGPLPTQIEIPTAWEKGGFDWRNPFESHSAYGRSLEAIENDPNSPLRDVLDLPFGIDIWSKTETFRANDEAREATLACGG
jgi:hypothetical protein